MPEIRVAIAGVGNCASSLNRYRLHYSRKSEGAIRDILRGICVLQPETSGSCCSLRHYWRKVGSLLGTPSSHPNCTKTTRRTPPRCSLRLPPTPTCVPHHERPADRWCAGEPPTCGLKDEDRRYLASSPVRGAGGLAVRLESDGLIGTASPFRCLGGRPGVRRRNTRWSTATSDPQIQGDDHPQDHGELATTTAGSRSTTPINSTPAATPTFRTC